MPSPDYLARARMGLYGDPNDPAGTSPIALTPANPFLDAIRADLAPAPSATGPTALADASGAIVLPADKVESQPVGLAKIARDAGHVSPDAPVGLAAIAPSGSRLATPEEQLYQAGDNLAASVQGHGAAPKRDLVPVVPPTAGVGGGGRPAYVTPSDAGAGASRERAARAHEAAAEDARRGTPGVYDPGGARVTAFSTQRTPGASTAPSREHERAEAAGVPAAVFDGAKANLVRLAPQIDRLTQAAAREKNPGRRLGLLTQLQPLVAQRDRLAKVVSPFFDKGPGDQEALADLESKEKTRGRVERADLDAGVRQQEAKDEGGRQEAQLLDEQAQVQGDLHQRRTAELDRVYAAMDEKRKQYESMEVDPGHWWSTRTTGQRVLGGIAIALGVLGSGENNAGVEAVNGAIKQDIQLQLEGIKKKGAELGHLAQQYEYAKNKFGTEEAGLAAANLAALTAVRAQAQQEVNRLGTERARQQGAILDARLAEEMAKRRLELERSALGTRTEQGVVTQAGYRGGRAPNMAKYAEHLDKAAEARGHSADYNDKVAEHAAKGDGQAHRPPGAIFVGGQGINADPRASQTTIDAAQKLIGYGEQGLATVGAIEKRTSSVGGVWPNDSARRLAADALASNLANAAGAGVPSESQLKLADEATEPGPRQQAALDEARRQLRGAIAGASGSVGAGTGTPPTGAK